MQVAILFDERSAAHQYYAGHTARQAVLDSGVLQMSGRLLVVRAGTVLLGHTPLAQRTALVEEAFFGDSWRRLDAPRLRVASQQSAIFAWVVSNIDRSTATHLDAALASERSYIGILAVNLSIPAHLLLYRRGLQLSMRIEGRSCSLFFRAFEEDGRDEAVFEHLSSLGFTNIEWEDIGTRDTIFDDFDTPDHFSRLESLKEFLSGTRSSGAEGADELLVVLEDLSPRLAATLGTAARSLLDATSEEDRAQVGVSARRYIEQLADALYPAREEKVYGRDVTRAKIKNRLWAYVVQQLSGSEMADRARIPDLGARVDLLVAEANAVVHAFSTSDRVPTSDRVRDMLAELAMLSVSLLALAPRDNRKPYFAYSPRVKDLTSQWLGGEPVNDR